MGKSERYEVHVGTGIAEKASERAWTWLVYDVTLTDHERTVACGTAPTEGVATAIADFAVSALRVATDGKVDELRKREADMRAEADRLAALADRLVAEVE